ncbi:hypothetical protein Bca52824_057474 [Brassica carinata]|nr:hypothetical protein Bca52824_057474 [Brassica carinata]
MVDVKHGNQTPLWSSFHRLMDLMEMRGGTDLGIHKHSLVGDVIVNRIEDARQTLHERGNSLE